MIEARRFVVGAIGWPGHVFPAIALARALRARGNAVVMASDRRWRSAVEAAELGFAEVPTYTFLGFPPAEDGLPTAAEAARAIVPAIGKLEPDAVVSDVFTVAPALAAELAGAPTATLIPYHYPVNEPGLPFFVGLPLQPVGLLPPRTWVGSAGWRALRRLYLRRARWERAALNEERGRLGLSPLERLHGAISERLAMVATFPQLEYPRRWPAHVRVCGPMLFELPHPAIELPPGDEPLVLVASSTLHDRELSLIAITLEALEGEPVRVVASINQRGRAWDESVPPNAVVADWVSYAQVMPHASLVVCHGGHGTVVRALAAGVPVLVCPGWGDQADNGARLTWSGAGLSIPRRMLGPRAIRLATRRLLADRAFADRAWAIAAWDRGIEGAERGAVAVEELARDSFPARPG